MLRLALTEGYGTYHCAGAGECSWHELACAVLDEAGVGCVREALTTAEYRRRFPGAAPRPAHSALDCSRIAAAVGVPMRPWREALSDFAANLGELGE